jgi:hypothetical protein
VYFAGYRSAVEKRLPGFFIQSTACFLPFIGAATGVIMHFDARLMRWDASVYRCGEMDF